METCKYGSGAGKRKPTAVKRKGVVYRAYVRSSTDTMRPSCTSDVPAGVEPSTSMPGLR